MNRPVIVGAGMAGLLAANMLSRHRPIVLEAANMLPNNHHALLRFRSAAVGDVLGIDFRKVRVIKCSVPMATDAAAALAYSFKSTGVYRSDRSLPNGTETGERFIAPSDLIDQMFKRAEAAGVEFRFGTKFSPTTVPPTTIISTIPMPALMAITGHNKEFVPEFRAIKGIVYRATIPDCDAFATVYDPRPDTPFTRASITGDQLIIERPLAGTTLPWSNEGILQEACDLLGINHSVNELEVEVKPQNYAKILPVDESLRRHFIHRATDQHNIYSLGRFATWRPGLLLDDLVQDIRMIERWSSEENRYEIARHR